ncbi:MAG: PEP-utilizing enzyme [Acidimicrobiales bacterium]
MFEFTPPGAGHWDLDKSHYDGGTTPMMQDLMADGVESAYEQLFETFGVPLRAIRFRWVNGFAYTRQEPLVGAKSNSSKPPPAWAVRALARSHPEFRRREAAAAKTLSERPWKAVVDEWFDDLSGRYTAMNLGFQAVVPADLDDSALARHLAEVHLHTARMYFEHHRLHGYDLGPVGRLAAGCSKWGITAAEVVQTLSGASPHTAGPVEEVAGIRAAIEATGADLGSLPADLDALRALSPDIEQAIDRYMERHGWVLYTGYDLDAVTMAETPNVLATTILRGELRQRTVDHMAAIDGLRERVPQADRDEFDDLVADARAAMGMRDAQGPITVEWPTGLLRRALVETGQRLHSAGHLELAEHVLEFTLDEAIEALEALASGSEVSGPKPSELAARAAIRRAQKDLDPPRSLGPPAVAPPLDALPPAMAELVSVVATTVEEMGMGAGQADDVRPSLTGLGIGTLPFTGRAVVATSAEQALERLQPGDVLVTLTTSPAYNLVLSMVGGLVTAEGGPVCHAAVLSRELGLPAVIGVRDALTSIPDGAIVDLDPSAGLVRVHGTD